MVQRYPDGSGSVQGAPATGIDKWTINCAVDAMSDRRDCSLHNLQAGLLVSYGQSSAPKTICAISHDFPGRTGQIRIDGNSPVTTSRDGCVQASTLISQMKAGSTATVRYYSWPNDYPKDSSGSLAGFNKALQMIDETLAR